MSPPLALTSDDLDRIEEASRVLLGPLAAPDADAWRVEVLATLRPLFEADHAIFSLTNQPRVFLSEWDTDPVTDNFLTFVSIEAGTFGPSEQGPALWLDEHRRRGHGAFTTGEMEAFLRPRGLTLAASPTMARLMHPNGIYDSLTFTAEGAGAEAAVQLNYGRRDAPAAERWRGLARALAPSLRAGLDVLGRLAGQRTALDALAEPVVVLSADGREVHRNAALVRLLDADPERLAVERELWALARALRRLLFPLRADGGAGPPLGMHRAVQTAAAHYALSAARVPAGALGPGETALVTVAATPVARPLAPADIAARTGLSPREAEVAVLVAGGLTNAQIANRLFVAPGTVKRHVENVLDKLDVPTRAAVAARLTGADSRRSPA